MTIKCVSLVVSATQFAVVLLRQVFCKSEGGWLRRISLLLVCIFTAPVCLQAAYEADEMVIFLAEARDLWIQT